MTMLARNVGQQHFRLVQVAILAALGLAILLSAAPAQSAAPSLIQVSLGQSGSGGNAASSAGGQAMSADGRYVIFASTASNLASNDTNSQSDAYVRDEFSGTTTLVSVNGSGVAANGPSTAPAISGNGRYVVFQSTATDLDTSFTESGSNIYERDLQAGTTHLVSISSSGSAGNSCAAASVSSDGRYIAFTCTTTLVPTANGSVSNVYVRDTSTVVTTLVSSNSSGTGSNGNSQDGEISADGSYVAFDSDATNLTSNDLNGATDVFRKTLSSGQTILVSLSAVGVGVQGNGRSYNPSISAHGDVIAFESDATNLVTADLNSATDVFVRTLSTNATAIVSINGSGAAGNGASHHPAVSSLMSGSSDGRYVAFYSAATDLVTGGTGTVFVRDLNGATTSSIGATGGDMPSLTPEGRFVAFTTLSSLLASDANGVADVYRHDAGETTPPVISGVSVSPSKISPTGTVTSTTFSAAITEDTPSIDWTIAVKNGSGVVVRSFSGNIPGLSGTVSQIWDGKDSGGAVVPDGLYSLVLSATDGWNNSASSTASVTVQTAPPSVTGLGSSPTAFSPNGDGIKDTTTIGATVSDPSPTTTWTLVLADGTGAAKRTYSGSNAGSSFIISQVWDGKDSAGVVVPTGTYSGNLTVTDALGNSSTSSASIVVDLTPPAASISSPSSGSTVSSVTTISASASDPESGTASVSFYYRNVFSDGSTGPWHQLGVSSTTPYAASWRTVSVGDGPIDLGVSAVDGAGNGTGVVAIEQVVVMNNDYLGPQSFYDLREWSIDSRTQLWVDAFHGNAAFRMRLSKVSAPGPEESVYLTYNSRSRSSGPLGFGWNLGLIDHLEPQQDGSVIFAAGLGARYRFYSSSVAGTYRRPPGLHLTLTQDVASGTYTLSDLLGQQWTFDAAGNVESVTDRNGRARMYSYAGGKLISITSPGGRLATLSYNGAGYLASIRDSASHSSIFTYDGTGNLIGLTDPANHSMSFAYDSDHRMLRFTSLRGGQFRFSYLSGGQFDWVQTITDPLGHNVVIGYSSISADSSRTITDELGKSSSYLFNAKGIVLSSTDPMSLVDSYEIDSDNNVTSHTDAAGHVWTYSYNAAGQQVSTTDPSGETVLTGYNDLNLMSSQTDAAGNVKTYAYDARGNLASMSTARWKTTTLSYDAAGNLISMTRPKGDVTRFGEDSAGRVNARITPRGGTYRVVYDTSGNPISVTNPTNDTWTMGYDVEGNQTSITDPLGHGYAYVFGAAGDLSQATDPRGGVTTYTTDAMGHVVTIVDPRGGVTTLSYDAAGRLSKLVDPRGGTTSYTYDDDGRLSRVADPRGGTSTFVYTVLGQVAATVDPRNGATNSTYDQRGLLTSETTPLGTETYSHDLNGRLIRKTDAAGNSTQFGYDSDGNPVSWISGRGLVNGANPNDFKTSWAWDDNGQIASTTTPTGEVMSYAHDLDGNLVGQTDSAGHTLAFAYDLDDRRIGRTDADGNTTTVAYDVAGRVSSLVDPAGNTPGGIPSQHTTTFQRDANGWIIGIADPLGDKTTYSYDPGGSLTSVTDPRGNQPGANPGDYRTTITRDVAGQATQVVDPLGDAYAPTYDTAGQLTQVAGPLGTLSYAYSGAGDLNSVSYPTPDGGTQTIQHSFDSNGDLTRIADPSGTTTFAYDALSALTGINGPSSSATFSYDPDGNRQSAAVPAGSLTYSWRADDQVQSITANSAVTSFAYDPQGRLSQMTLPGGQVDELATDPAGLPMAVTFKKSAAASPDETRQVRYSNGLPVSIDDTVSGRTLQTFAWDKARRLSGESYWASGSLVSVNYSVDASGNRTGRTASDELMPESFSYDRAGRLTSHVDGLSLTTNYSYNGEGDLVQATGASPAVYKWAIGKRLVQSIKGTSTVNYAYDGEGRLTQASTPIAATKLIYDGSRLSRLVDGSGTTLMSFVYTPNGSPVSLTVPSAGTYYVHLDSFGSVVRITDPLGQVAVQYGYDANGAMRSLIKGSAWNDALSRNPLRFRANEGGLFIDAASLYWTDGSVYDPSIGRFLASVRGSYQPCLASADCPNRPLINDTFSTNPNPLLDPINTLRPTLDYVAATAGQIEVSALGSFGQASNTVAATAEDVLGTALRTAQSTDCKGRETKKPTYRNTGWQRNSVYSEAPNTLGMQTSVGWLIQIEVHYCEDDTPPPGQNGPGYNPNTTMYVSGGLQDGYSNGVGNDDTLLFEIEYDGIDQNGHYYEADPPQPWESEGDSSKHMLDPVWSWPDEPATTVGYPWRWRQGGSTEWVAYPGCSGYCASGKWAWPCAENYEFQTSSDSCWWHLHG